MGEEKEKLYRIFKTQHNDKEEFLVFVPTLESSNPAKLNSNSQSSLPFFGLGN